LTAAVSLLATLITFVFTGAVVRQYLRRGGRHRLIWGVALLCYGVATAVQFIAELRGWETGTFRAWYLSGGLLTAAYLGQGTAALLLPRRVASVLLVILVTASLWGAYRIATVPLMRSQILPPAGKISPSAGDLPTDVRALAALLNIYGTILLIGGAIWSAVVYVDHRLDRKRRAGYRLLSNLLIAGGSLVVASAGSLETFGHGEYLYAGEIAGITIIFVGFLRSRESMRWPFQRIRRSPAIDPILETRPGATAAAAMPAQSARALKRLSDRGPTPRR
jgi:hypothetical protein